MKRGKVCDLMFVVPCEGSEAEALKYMRGVNLACVAWASLLASKTGLGRQPRVSSSPKPGVGSG